MPARALAALIALVLLSCGSLDQLGKRQLHPMQLIEDSRLGNRPLRPTDLLEDPSSYLNRVVEVEILEPVMATYTQVKIDIPEGGSQLLLVPKGFEPRDPRTRYKQKFDRLVQWPLRVSGEFLSDDYLVEVYHRPDFYVIRVSSIEPVVLDSPQHVTLSDIKSHPTGYDRRYIVYEGVYECGFEQSSLDEIWLETAPNVTIVGHPARCTSMQYESHRVRATGILFVKPGARYGHRGGSEFQMLASRVEYLGQLPRSPRVP